MIQEKQCNKCKVVKPFADFGPRKNGKFGLNARCRVCVLTYKREYVSKNRKVMTEKNHIYYINNKESIQKKAEARKDEIKIYQAKYRALHKVKASLYNKKWYIDNQDWVKEYKKQYYILNADRIAAARKKWTAQNKLKLSDYRKNNKKHIQQLKNNRSKIRRAEEPAYKLRCYIGAKVSFMLHKNNSTKENTSCWSKILFTNVELVKYLESLFEDWMNWDNYGKYNPKTHEQNPTWNIDHIIPQSDLPYASMDEENFKKCWALENLRPYDSKQNSLDGSNRTRHNKVQI